MKKESEVNEEYDLTDEELIDDALSRAFVMVLGTQLPEERVMEHMCSWVKIQSNKTDESLTEDFVFSQIPKYINFIFKR